MGYICFEYIHRLYYCDLGFDDTHGAKPYYSFVIGIYYPFSHPRRMWNQWYGIVKRVVRKVKDIRERKEATNRIILDFMPVVYLLVVCYGGKRLDFVVIVLDCIIVILKQIKSIIYDFVYKKVRIWYDMMDRLFATWWSLLRLIVNGYGAI